MQAARIGPAHALVWRLGVRLFYLPIGTVRNARTVHNSPDAAIRPRLAMCSSDRHIMLCTLFSGMGRTRARPGGARPASESQPIMGLAAAAVVLAIYVLRRLASYCAPVYLHGPSLSDWSGYNNAIMHTLCTHTNTHSTH